MVGIHVLKLGDHVFGNVVEERLLVLQQFAVAQRPPHDPAQDITAPLVGGQNAVVNKERTRARMVGDDPQRNVGLRILVMLLASDFADVLDDAHQ